MQTPPEKPAAAQLRRPKHDPKETEREILEAAEQLLRERPFREINVDEIMRRTGLKRPAFYVHFRDKHDVVLRVVQEIGRELFETAADHWLKGNDPYNDAKHALRNQVQVYLRHGPVLRALSEASSADERVEQAYRGLVQEFITATAQHIREEQARGRIGPLVDVDETARALTWLDERYLSEALGRTPQVDPDVVTQVLYNIWISTLYGNNAPPARRKAASTAQDSPLLPQD